MSWRASSRLKALAFSIAAVVMISQLAAAELPHENFDLVGSDIDMIIELLRAGINATELSCVSCLDLRPADGAENLSLLEGVLVPVTALLDEIREITDVYDNLTYLTPPFTNLTDGGDAFNPTFGIFLDDLDIVRDYSQLSSLTPQQFVVAQGLISSLRQMVHSLNHALDEMDAAAIEIANLTIDQERPFDTTYLRELIDRLRILIDFLASEIDDLFFSIRWGTPFITLVLDDDAYYLGQTVYGEGYVYDGETTVVGRTVNVSINGSMLASDSTNSQGRYSFEWTIPIDPIYLGQHSLNASAMIKGVKTYSVNRTIIVLKIPTELRLWINGEEFEPDDTVTIRGLLVDYGGFGIGGQSIEGIIDSAHFNDTTDYAGGLGVDFAAMSLGWGDHSASLHYNGTDVYEPSLSDIKEFEVDIRTWLELSLSTNRVEKGDEVSVWCELYANESDPLTGRIITITIDGGLLVSSATDLRGNLTYALNTSQLTVGTHILRAYFEGEYPMFRENVSNAAPLTVFVTADTSGGGNGGSSPGDWWDNIVDWISDWLWLLLLIAIIIIITVLVMSTETYRNAKEAGRKPALREKVEAEGSPATTEVEEASTSIESAEQAAAELPKVPPRDAVIRRYSQLLESLSSVRGIELKANMTAREIAAKLRNLSYPDGPIERVTTIFEQARYSPRAVTDEDAKVFEDAAESIESRGEMAK